VDKVDALPDVEKRCKQGRWHFVSGLSVTGFINVLTPLPSAEFLVYPSFLIFLCIIKYISVEGSIFI